MAALERSGLSGAAFARQHGIDYTTFCFWRRRRPASPEIGFAEVELVRPPSPDFDLGCLGGDSHTLSRTPSAYPIVGTLLQEA